MTAELLAAGITALRAGDAATAIAPLQAAAAGGDGLAALNLGLALIQTGRLADAEAALRQAVAALPERPEPFLYLGQVVGLRGAVAEARHCFETALARDPGQMLALVGLASLAEAGGDIAGAADCIDRARALDPLEPELDAWAARIARRRGAPRAALDAALAALAAKPSAVEAAKQAAAALLTLEGEAGARLFVAAQAAAEPFSLAWPLTGAMLAAMTGDLDGALAELRMAEALAPELPEVQAELGLALAAANQPQPAMTALRRALVGRPNDLLLRNRLATLLSRAHRVTEAKALLEWALREFGPDPVPLMNLALIHNARGDQVAALDMADAAVALASDRREVLATRLFVLGYHPDADAMALRRAAEEAAAQYPAALPRIRTGEEPERPLRIGLLSGNLGAHPVGWLTIAGLEALPEAEFALTAYSLRRRQDPIGARFRARCAHWRELGTADDAAIAAAMTADGIDILIDLGGYGDGGRPGVAARRAAPVQVKWVGAQSSTTGLPGMDWMLTDRWETPPGFERFYTERLLRLPDGYVCYTPPADLPAITPLPMQARGHVTFGCFNNLAKVTPRVLAAWSRILDAVAGSRLVLRTHVLADDMVRDGMVQKLRVAGIDPARVEMHGGVPHRDLLSAYGDIDLALDPFPYAGGLTVCEALVMGVPVVSLHGDGFAMRHGLSHLSNVGLGDWSVPDVESYVALAIRRAQDPGALAALREGLRARVLASPLCDAPRFGRGLGTALRRAWREYCGDAARVAA
jgi:protein O-GlcNAc transferase